MPPRLPAPRLPAPRLRDARALFAALHAHGKSGGKSGDQTGGKSGGGARLTTAFALLMLGSLTEGLSVLLMLPILGLVSTASAGAPVIALPARDLAGLSLPALTVPLWALLVGLVALMAAQALFNRLRSVHLSDLLQGFANGLCHDLFAAIAHARWPHLVRLRVADLEHALTGEVARIQSAAMLILSMVQGVVTLVLYTGLGLMISVPMTLFSAAFGMGALLVLAPYRHVAAQYGQRMQDNRQRQYRAVSGFLGGLKPAKAMNRTDEEIAGFSALLTEAQADARAFSRRAADGAGLFKVALGIGAALFIHLALTVAHLGVAEIVVLMLVLMRLAPRFMALQAQAQQLLVDLPAWAHVAALRADLMQQRDPAAPVHATPTPDAPRLPPLHQEVRLDRVTCRHDATLPPVLHDCSLILRAGHVTALIGPSGSGKTTVADLVCGLIRPERGLVLIDGRAPEPAEMRAWRSRIAYVAQESWLPAGTLRQVLAAAAPPDQPPPDETAMRLALRQAAAAGFVGRLPQGLDTPLGDRGTRLSGGERQRIALARALLRRPDLLILDEATSALDWQSQNAVARTIRGLRGQMTVLTIAHRPSMVEFADAVFALEGGRIVESGDPAYLRLRPNGVLRRMLMAEGAAAMTGGADGTPRQGSGLG